MKQIVLSLLILAIFINSTSANHNQQQGNIIISGEILNYEKYPDQQFVEIFIYDPFAEPINEILFLNEKGTFQLEFKRLYPQEISISFKRRFLIYVLPGDSVHITIDANVLETKNSLSGHRFDYIKITGDNEKLQEDFRKFQKIYFNSVFNVLANKDAITSLNPDDYKEFIRRRTND